MSELHVSGGMIGREILGIHCFEVQVSCDNSMKSPSFANKGAPVAQMEELFGA